MPRKRRELPVRAVYLAEEPADEIWSRVAEPLAAMIARLVLQRRAEAGAADAESEAGDAA